MLLLAASVIATPPNIVYVMADDLGYGELGCYGQEKIPTPNLDQMARQGVRFTRFYSASPVCAPTRCSLLTGKHQGHAAIRGNKEQGGFGPNDPEGQFPLPQSETTIAEVLRTRGYATAIIGKWAMGGPDPRQTPDAHGFDRFYGYLCQRRAHTHYPPYLWSDHSVDLQMTNRPMSAHQKIAGPLPSEQDYYERFTGGEHSHLKMTGQCLAFIRQNKAKPFFLYFAPIIPHAALQAPKEWVDKFPREWDKAPYLGAGGYLPTARPRATYAAMISMLDDSMGQILTALKDLNLDRNTLVVFTSDNGATFNGGVDREFFRSNGNLRAGKMSLYEGGCRVPFIARWPASIPAGTQSDHPAICWDTFATLAQISGARAPKTDGLSYAPSLMGKPQPKRDYIYFEYPEASSMQAVLFGRFKVIKPNLSKNPSAVEVYDLVADPSETTDLAKSRPDLVKRAERILLKEHVPNPNFPLPGVDPVRQSAGG